MYMVYIDDSGDTGFKSRGSRTDAFVLAAVLIRDTDWLRTLDELINFRRFLRRSFGVQTRAELKAGYFIHGTGPFSTLNLSEEARMRVYKMSLRFQEKVGTIKTWAVVVDKDKFESKRWRLEVRDMAWENMIQRLERFTAACDEPCVVFPDEGHPAYVQKLFRKMRRFSRPASAFVPGTTLNRPAALILEDPNFRRSNESYFVQLADFNAYAAHRHIFPKSYCGAEYWDYLGSAREERVNKLRGGPTGIVLRP